MQIAELIMEFSYWAARELESLWALISARAEIVAALFTALAATAAWYAVRTTKRVAQGNLLARHVTDYASEEMADALQLLGNLLKKKAKQESIPHERDLTPEQRDAIAKEWKEVYEDDCRKPWSDASKINKARRRVAHYFGIALQLRKLGCIDNKFLREICPKDTLEMLYGIVEHFEKANAEFIGRSYCKDTRRAYDELLKYYDEETKNRCNKIRPKRKNSDSEK